MSLLSYYFKTFNYPTTFSHCKSNHCHTAAFCQKIILEFVARCRWNGKKYFWATLLLKPSILLRSHCRILPGKKIISHFKTTELTLVCDRKFWILRNPACSNLSVPNYWFAYSNSFWLTFASSIWQSYQGTFPIWNHATSIIHRFFLVSTINSKWVRGSNPGWEEEVLIAN